MDVSYICEFATLVESENFQTTAERLFISQSTLSKHISKLEKDLGVQLLEHAGRRAVLSRHGKQFLPHALKIRAEVSEYTELFAREREAEDNRLALGYIPVMAQCRIDEIISQFQEEVPQCAFSVCEHYSLKLEQLLSSGECDLAFLRGDDVSLSMYHHIKYAEVSLCAVIPKAHPLSSKTTLSIMDLKGERLLTLESHSNLGHRITDLCNGAGFEPLISFSAQRLDNIIRQAEKGSGIGVLFMGKDSSFPKSVSNEKCSIAEFYPRIVDDIYLCFPKGKKHSSYIKRFISIASKTSEFYDFPLE